MKCLKGPFYLLIQGNKRTKTLAGRMEMQDLKYLISGLRATGLKVK